MKISFGMNTKPNRSALRCVRALQTAGLLRVVGILMLAAAPNAQPPNLDVVLSRVEQYLVDYYAQLGSVVAEERYEQWVEVASQSPSTSTMTTGQIRLPGSESSGASRRVLVSDFLLMHEPGQGAWLGFRDVLLVDGKPVRDRQQRLSALAALSADLAVARAAKIAEESARYNIGEVFRTINVPTQALDFFHPANRTRFSFRRTGEDSIDGSTVWKIEYEEREPPFLIRTLTGHTLRSTGIALVSPLTGAVVQTQLDLAGLEAGQFLRSRITVRYRQNAAWNVLVPVELRETHELSDPINRGVRTRTEGRARYLNFRRFETSGRLLPR